MNQKRAELDLPALTVVVVGLIRDDLNDDKISSTYFRQAMSESVSQEQLLYLKQSWEESLQKFDLSDAKKIIFLWKLFRLYNQPWRKYHTLVHIFDLCKKADSLKGLSTEDKSLLKLTAFFHDAIYVPTSKKNEEVTTYYSAKCRTDISVY